MDAILRVVGLLSLSAAIFLVGGAVYYTVKDWNKPWNK